MYPSDKDVYIMQLWNICEIYFCIDSQGYVFD